MAGKLEHLERRVENPSDGVRIEIGLESQGAPCPIVDGYLSALASLLLTLTSLHSPSWALAICRSLSARDVSSNNLSPTFNFETMSTIFLSEIDRSIETIMLDYFGSASLKAPISVQLNAIHIPET